MKKVISMLLVLLLVCGLTGCGVPEEILGVWNNDGYADRERAEALLLEWGFTEVDIACVDLEKLGRNEILTLNEDETYTITLDMQRAEASFRSYCDVAVEGLYDHRTDFDAQLGALRLEDWQWAVAYLYGFSTYEELKDYYVELGLAYYESLGALESGTYSVSGKTITFTPDGGESYKVQYEMKEPWGYMNLWYDDDTVELHTPDLRVQK